MKLRKVFNLRMSHDPLSNGFRPDFISKDKYISSAFRPNK